MARNTTVLHSSIASLIVSHAVARLSTVANSWRKLIQRLHGRYRPERHYMRGPGPKWREKRKLRAE